MAHEYDVFVKYSEGRKGVASSSVLPTSIDVATPPEFPKGVPGFWSPEHLFVAAVNSCLMTTFLAIAENSKLEFQTFECHATGKLEKVENIYAITEIVLRPFILVNGSHDIDKGMRILQKAETACLISNSIKSKVILDPSVKSVALPV
jgi:organic hydroperoxide reductase OsmC/OhrA